MNEDVLHLAFLTQAFPRVFEGFHLGCLWEFEVLALAEESRRIIEDDLLHGFDRVLAFLHL